MSEQYSLTGMTNYGEGGDVSERTRSTDKEKIKALQAQLREAQAKVDGLTGYVRDIATITFVGSLWATTQKKKAIGVLASLNIPLKGE